MQLNEIIRTVYAAGGRLWLEGDKLHARLPEKLRPLVPVIRERKPEIVDLLSQRPAMPAGVRLVRWEPKIAPVELSRCETVVDVDKFIRSTLMQVEARLHGKDWLAGWTLSTLIDRLAAVGCHVTLDDGKAALQ